MEKNADLIKVKKNIVILLRAAVVLILAALFLQWLRRTAYSPCERAVAGASLLLFLALCLRLVPVYAEKILLPLFAGRRSRKENAGRNESADRDENMSRDENVSRDENKDHAMILIFLKLLLLCVLLHLLVWLVHLCNGQYKSFGDAFEFWRRMDGNHYLDIARDWYLSQGTEGRIVQLVFLPGYPIAIRLFNTFIRYDLLAAVTVSCLSFAGSGCVLYRLVRIDHSPLDACRAVRFLCLIPGVFFFAAPMSESLFLLLSVLCIYEIRQGRWLAGCICGGLAAFTRSPGITLLVPAFVIWLEEIGRNDIKQPAKSRRFRQAASLLLIPAGFGAYCLVNYQVSGDLFRFLVYQKENWNQSLGLFFNTTAYQTNYAIRTLADNMHLFLGLWLPNLLCIFLCLLLMFWAAKKIRPEMSAWLIAYFCLTAGATWLLSAPRYMAGCFAVPLALTAVTDSRGKDTMITVGCTLLSAAYLYAYAMQWGVM